MRIVDINDLGANLLKYLEKASRGEQITVTTHSRVLATIVPPTDKKALARKQLNELVVTANIHDITSLVETPWEALS